MGNGELDVRAHMILAHAELAGDKWRGGGLIRDNLALLGMGLLYAVTPRRGTPYPATRLQYPPLSTSGNF